MRSQADGPRFQTRLDLSVKARPASYQSKAKPRYVFMIDASIMLHVSELHGMSGAVSALTHFALRHLFF